MTDYEELMVVFYFQQFADGVKHNFLLLLVLLMSSVLPWAKDLWKFL